VPAAVPAVAAEVALQIVAHDDVVAVIPRPDDPPHDGARVEIVAVALDDASAAVAARRRRVGRDREVAAVGGAVEEDVGDTLVHDPVHLPRRVQRRAARAQGDADPVLVGVEVRAELAALQPHVRPVGEEVHRRRPPLAVVRRRARGVCSLLAGDAVGERREREEQRRCSVAGRLRLGLAGQFVGGGGRTGLPSQGRLRSLHIPLTCGSHHQAGPDMTCGGQGHGR